MPPDDIEIVPADPAEPDVGWCFKQYFEEIDRRFDTGFDVAEGAGEPLDIYAPPTGLILVARRDGVAVGCGALTRRREGFAEIKRMWVSDAVRGTGLGQRLLTALEGYAADAGDDIVRLDTNRALTEAHSLYRTNGYTVIARYNDNPYAQLWFEKNLCAT